MSKKYLLHFGFTQGDGTSIVEGPLNLDGEGIDELEAEFAKRNNIKEAVLLNIVSLPQDSEPNKEDDNIRFIVNNKTAGTFHYFEYRNEAIDFYNASVAEKGDGAEYELLMRLKHHIPSFF